jgi:hypothetical protein
MRAFLRTLVAVAAVILLVHGITPHGAHFSALSDVRAGQAAPATGAPPETAPAPEDTDHDGCPKPVGHPCPAGWVKPVPAPSRHGGRPRRGPRAAGGAASVARMPVAGLLAVRHARPTGPRLPVFRC